ncbi:MAG: cytochrome C oxidase subunit IV family protein [Candidatus Acidiferrales bacterium]
MSEHAGQQNHIGQPTHHIVPLKIYFAVFAALMTGTTLTVWAAFFDFGPLNTVIALAIAGIKATLVILFFMHVKYSKPLLWVLIGSGFFWLALLVTLTISDYVSRPV